MYVGVEDEAEQEEAEGLLSCAASAEDEGAEERESEGGGEGGFGGR